MPLLAEIDSAQLTVAEEVSGSWSMVFNVTSIRTADFGGIFEFFASVSGFPVAQNASFRQSLEGKEGTMAIAANNYNQARNIRVLAGSQTAGASHLKHKPNRPLYIVPQFTQMGISNWSTFCLSGFRVFVHCTR